MSAKRIAGIGALAALLLAVLVFPIVNSGGQITELTGTDVLPLFDDRLELD